MAIKVMIVKAKPIKTPIKETQVEKKKALSPQPKMPTLKRMQAKTYPFLDSDVLGIFNDLLGANHIELPEIK